MRYSLVSISKVISLCWWGILLFLRGLSGPRTHSPTLWTHDKSEQRAAKQRCDLFAVTLTVTHTQTAHRPFTIFLSTILPPKKLKHNTTLLVLPLSLWGCFTPSGIEDGRSQGLAGRRGEFGSAWNWYINLKLWRWRRCQLGHCGSPKDKLTNIGNR